MYMYIYIYTDCMYCELVARIVITVNRLLRNRTMV